MEPSNGNLMYSPNLQSASRWFGDCSAGKDRKVGEEEDQVRGCLPKGSHRLEFTRAEQGSLGDDILEIWVGIHER